MHENSLSLRRWRLWSLDAVRSVPLRRALVVLALLELELPRPAAAQSGCIAKFEKRGGLSSPFPWCQGQVVDPMFARLDPNCAPFNTNGTFSEARLSPNLAGEIVLGTQGFVRAPALDNAVYISTGRATATGDIRYVGPSTSLTLTLAIQGIENAQGTITDHSFQVKCGPSPAVGYSLAPLGTPHTFTLIKTFPVTNGATFDLLCSGSARTSGANSTTGRWVGWSFSATLVSATISDSGAAFQLDSASLPIRYWPPLTPPSAYCAPAVGTSAGCFPTITANAQPNVAHSTPCVVTASNVDGQRSGLLIYGVNGAQFTPWCNGGLNQMCVAPPRQRTSTQNSGGTAGACDGVLTLDWNTYQLGHPTALGNPWIAGATVEVQGWFRDPPACKASAVTEALRLVYQ